MGESTMIKPICKDIFTLGRKAAPAQTCDLPTADDLLDTLRANASGCVGMAANMIGIPKAIIVFTDENGKNREMFNPKLLSGFGEYEAEEGCLSLVGMRKAKRFQMITVAYETREFKPKKETFTGFTAQIIQHELDHLKGVII